MIRKIKKSDFHEPVPMTSPPHAPSPLPELEPGACSYDCRGDKARYISLCAHPP